MRCYNIIMNTITPILAFSDNYIWLIQNPESNAAIIVDPGDGQVVLDELKKKDCNLKAILVTHHHYDHSGGLSELLKHFTVPIYGPQNDFIPSVSNPVKEGDSINIEGFDEIIHVLDIPAHTKGHIAFYTKDFVFVGDTLFSGGCGRLFEGTAEQMFNALLKLSKLPDETRVYCGHEYTEKNLRFARLIEPNNMILKQHYEDVLQSRKENKPTIPSTIGLEKEINPFLRCHIDNVKLKAEEHAGRMLASPIDVLATLRKWKDRF